MIAILNPLLEFLVRSPLGRFMRPFALLEFMGKKSGRRYRILVGWYESDGVGKVFTPAKWRTNFRSGAETRVHHRGGTRMFSGTLITDPEVVARSLDALLTNGVAPRMLGLDVPKGHRITAEDVRTVRRAMIESRSA
jgi:hypothetical protein